MKFNQILLASAICATTLGMIGCGGDEDANIIVEAPSTTPTPTTAPATPGVTLSECPAWTSAELKDGDTNVCRLPATILESRELTSDIRWRMESRVTVGNGNQEMSAVDGKLKNDDTDVSNVELSIQAGTHIVAKNDTFANLLITRGSTINAIGSAEAPIIFSSEDEGFDGAGEWGGIIIHGYGLHNQCKYEAEPERCNVDAEGESGLAGGHNNDDSSGTMQYVVIAEGGYEFAVGDEINGLSLIAVGNGTTLDYIQVHNNADDGIEYYGGDVNTKHLVLTGNQDDSIDWDEGFTGNIQFALVQQSAATEGNAIEADTEGTTSFYSLPTIANATFIADGSKNVMHVLKKSSGGFIHNSIMTSPNDANKEYCLTLDGQGAQDNAAAGRIGYSNVLADCANFESVTNDKVISAGTLLADNGRLVNVVTDAAAELSAPNLASTAEQAKGLPELDIAAYNTANPESKADPSFFEETTYMGAVDPDASGDAWFKGWTVGDL